MSKNRSLIPIMLAFVGIYASIFFLSVEGSADQLSLYQEAISLYKDGKNNESLQKLYQATEIDPNFADAYTLSGIVMYAQLQDNKSLAPLKTAIDLYENGNASLSSEYNGIYENKGDPFFWYGSSLSGLKRYNESSDMFTKAMENYEAYKKALETPPKIVSTNISDGNNLSKVIFPDGSTGYYPSKEFANAINITKSRNTQDLANAYYWKGYSLYLMGLPEESMNYFNKARSINKNFESYSSLLKPIL